MINATGLGTSAVHIGRPKARQAKQESTGIPGLYSPEPVRDDRRLADEVNDRLESWCQDLGIFTEYLDRLRQTDFGRLAMLTHPDTDDANQLMLAARCLVAEWAVDDVYCDDEAIGSAPELTPARLTLALGAVERPQLLGEYPAQLADAQRADPVLMALRSSVDGVAGSAMPAQVGRLRHELANLFVAMAGEAGWRISGRMPPVWEYLVSRQLNSFQPCLALIDVVGGYLLHAEIYYDQRVRRATSLAAVASTIANDLYSLSRESGPGIDKFNLPTLIAAEQNCALPEAIERSVEYHNDAVRRFEAAQRELAVIPSPELNRYLWGVHAWIGGSNEWHRSSGRYQAA